MPGPKRPKDGHESASLAVGPRPTGGVVLVGASLLDDETHALQLDVLRADGSVALHRRLPLADGDVPFTALVRSDGRLAVAGTSRGPRPLFLATFGPKGDPTGRFTLGGPAILDLPTSIAPTVRGGFLLVGGVAEASGSPSHDDLALVLVDRRGEIVWHRRFGGPGDDLPAAILPVTGGYLLVGHAGGNFYDGALWRIDPQGQLLWERRFAAPGQGEISLDSVVDVGDGFVAAGRRIVLGSSTGNDFFVCKVARDGTPVWKRTYGSAHDDLAKGIVRLGSGLLVAGTAAIDRDRPPWLLRLDGRGSRVW